MGARARAHARAGLALEAELVLGGIGVKGVKSVAAIELALQALERTLR